MKKHDFESTFKKNAKEQTPEMAERDITLYADILIIQFVSPN